MDSPSAPPPRRKTKTLLLTILGSAVAPSDLSLWQETYVRALVDLGTGEAAARQAISRAVATGWLTSTREGRRTRLRVPEEHRRGLAEGAARVDRFGLDTDRTGEWLVLVLSVPEQARSLRDRFRTQLGWLGFGSLGGGVWISPNAESETEIRALLADAGGLADVHLFRSATYADPDPKRLAEAAWDLSALRDRYDEFTSRVSALDPTDATETWAAWIELVTSWRHFPLVDPDLPDHLLPAPWPRRAARELYAHREAAWRPAALDHLADIERSIDA
jgi:phenylacetic acid degradation operon negative regulatory protein